MSREEIKALVIEYRLDNGLPKLSPSRLRNKVNNYYRQLNRGPVVRNNPTFAEVLERMEPGFTSIESGRVARPHGFRANVTSQYGNPLYAKEEANA